MAEITVTLDSEIDWAGFRDIARAHLLANTAPEGIAWHTPRSAANDLFSGSAEPGHPVAHAPIAVITVPRAFVSVCESVVLHSDVGRFGLLYRLLWRMQHEPGLRSDPLDPDMMRAQTMARAVHRDMHKMTAFVRFRPIERIDRDVLHVAWFEPEHHIVEATAPFFTGRFTQMEWAILTPERSARWDGKRLEFGPGGVRDDAPAADAGEALWLTYYRHIFNPARLKTDMMRKEMPRKYWHNLPEAQLIGELVAGADERSARMVEMPGTVPMRRIVPLEVVSAEAPDHNAALHDDPAQALMQLQDRVAHCRNCPIGEHATQAVFGEGPVNARLLIVGEQPGDQEDLRGRPFVGPAGQLFDRALMQLGWERSVLYVTNAVKHFKFEPRGKRRIHKTPSQQEAAACSHWLTQEIAQVRPAAMIALGTTAARALLGRQVTISGARGQWLADPQGVPVLVTLHPSALLRMDDADREDAYRAWLADLDMASDLLSA